MRILVTGSSGFIGSHLVRRLADEGHMVVGLDLNEPLDPYGLTGFVHGDIRIEEDVRTSLDTGVDCVINLAAKHYDFGITEEEYWDYNVNGSRCLLEGVRKAGVQHYMFYSTIAVYGDRLTSRCSEATETNPNTPYGESKLAAERIAVDWQAEDSQRLLQVVRPCVVYGPRNFTNTFNLIKQIDSGVFIQCGRGEAVKAMAYVENLVDATLRLLSRRNGGVQIFNYSDEPEVNVGDLVRQLHTLLGKQEPSIRMPMWAGVAAGYVFDLISAVTRMNFGVSSARVKKLDVPIRIDSSKIRQNGFVQPITIDEGLQRTVKWFVENFHDNPNPPINRLY